MPSRLARSRTSFSTAATVGSGFGAPSSRKSAFLLSRAASSKVPPTPTPAISGGQASGPAEGKDPRSPSLSPATPPAGGGGLFFETGSTQPPPSAAFYVESGA